MVHIMALIIFFLSLILHNKTVIKVLTVKSPEASKGPSKVGKKVANSSILQSWTRRYMPPTWTHFQKAPYSVLQQEIQVEPQLV